MNLAAADLLVLIFCLPATVVQDVTKTWFFGLILCKFVNYIQVCKLFNCFLYDFVVILFSSRTKRKKERKNKKNI